MALLSLGGCGAADDKDALPPEIGVVQEAAIGTNAIGTNAIGTNAIGTNAIGTNAIGTNALGPSAVALGVQNLAGTPTAAWIEADGGTHAEDRLKFLQYFVRCAGTSAQSVTYARKTGPTTTTSYSYTGSLGLAPRWVASTTAYTATLDDQQWVSACMAAHVNELQRQQTLGFAGFHPGLRATPAERAGLDQRGYASYYWGNLFQPDTGSRLNVCSFEIYYPLNPGVVLGRTCEHDGCGIMVHRGTCPFQHSGVFTGEAPPAKPTWPQTWLGGWLGGASAIAGTATLPCGGPYLGSGANGQNGKVVLGEYHVPVLPRNSYTISTCGTSTGSPYVTTSGACTCATPTPCPSGGGVQCTCTANDAGGDMIISASSVGAKAATWSYSVGGTCDAKLTNGYRTDFAGQPFMSSQVSPNSPDHAWNRYVTVAPPRVIDTEVLSTYGTCSSTSTDACVASGALSGVQVAACKTAVDCSGGSKMRRLGTAVARFDFNTTEAVTASDKYTVSLRYSSAVTTTARVVINGVAQTVTFPPVSRAPGEPATWDTYGFKALGDKTFSGGRVRIEISEVTGAPFPDLDLVMLYPGLPNT